MELLRQELAKTRARIQFYHVDKRYLKFLHDNLDYRVPVKGNRAFVALAVYINNCLYLVPLTSQTNTIRTAQGKKPRRNDLITKIYDSGEEIANLLYCSMFPADERYLEPITINPETDTYLANEERFLRSHFIMVNTKAVSIYQKRYDETHRDYRFLTWICCDFKKLEEHINDYYEREN